MTVLLNRVSVKNLDAQQSIFILKHIHTSTEISLLKASINEPR